MKDNQQIEHALSVSKLTTEHESDKGNLLLLLFGFLLLFALFISFILQNMVAYLVIQFCLFITIILSSRERSSITKNGSKFKKEA